MTETQGDLAALSKFIFRAPSWYSSLGFALFIAALAGVAAFDSRFVLEDAWQGVFFIGVPTVAASVLTPYVDRRLGGQLTHNRASLLALAGELLVVVVVTLAAVVAVVSPVVRSVLGAPLLGQDFVFDALILGLASVFAFRLLVIMAVSRNSMLVASLPASIQTLAAAVLLFVYSGTMRYFEVGGTLVDTFLARPERAPPELWIIGPSDFVLLAVMCVLYAGTVWVFLAVIDRPSPRGPASWRTSSSSSARRRSFPSPSSPSAARTGRRKRGSSSR